MYLPGVDEYAMKHEVNEYEEGKKYVRIVARFGGPIPAGHA